MSTPAAGESVLSLIGSWLSSYLRTGVGIIPVGTGSWLEERGGTPEGEIVVPNTFLLPIGRLHLVPRAMTAELFRRLRKGRHGLSVIKFLVGMLALSAVEAMLVDFDAEMFVVFVIISIELGLGIPLVIFGLRTRRFIRSQMRHVRAIPSVSLGFIMFGVLLYVIVSAYDVLAAYLLPTEGKRQAEFVESIIQDSVPEFLKKSGNAIQVVAMALLKAFVGFGILFGTTMVCLVSAESIVSSLDDLASLALPLGFFGALALGHHYFIRLERGATRAVVALQDPFSSRRR